MLISDHFQEKERTPTMKLPFRLLSAGGYKSPEPAADADSLPAEVSGQPAAYFWKEIIHTGNYKHPTREFQLNVDAGRLQKWLGTGQDMLTADVPIPINCDHSDRARDVVGYVKDLKIDGNRLMALCQFIGPDAALLAARNQVSAGIDPNFIDGQSRQWGEAIVHLALTPVPVVPNQGTFMPASLADDSMDVPTLVDADEEMDATNAIEISPEQFAAICQAVGAEAEIAPADLIELVLRRLASIAGKEDENDDAADSLERDDAGDSTEADDGADSEADDEENDSEEPSRNPDASDELSLARKQILELSARLPATLPPEAASAMVEAVTTKFDAAVTSGKLSPAARDRLVDVLVTNSAGPNLLTLSRSSTPNQDRSLAMSIAEILLENTSIDPGEATGLQTLSRIAPGEETSAMEQLRQYMTKVASVAG
jgi:hypothetical protein